MAMKNTSRDHVQLKWGGIIAGGVVFGNLLSWGLRLHAQQTAPVQVYDKHGHLLKSINPGGISWVFQYDAQGHVIGARNSRGQRLSFKVKSSQKPKYNISHQKLPKKNIRAVAARTPRGHK